VHLGEGRFQPCEIVTLNSPAVAGTRYAELVNEVFSRYCFLGGGTIHWWDRSIAFERHLLLISLRCRLPSLGTKPPP
jgi:hypothetical protein